MTTLDTQSGQLELDKSNFNGEKCKLVKDMDESHFTWRNFALSSLALLAMTAGCASRDVMEIINERPKASPDQVLVNKETWLDKEVSIYATPTLIEDNSTIYFSSGKYSHLSLHLDLRYKLSSENESNPPLYAIDDRVISLCNREFNPKNITAEYILKTTTYVVSGSIQKYSNSDEVYLKILNSAYYEK